MIIILTVLSIILIIAFRKYIKSIPASLDDISIRQFITYVLLAVFTFAICILTVVEYLRQFGLIGGT